MLADGVVWPYGLDLCALVFETCEEFALVQPALLRVAHEIGRYVTLRDTTTAHLDVYSVELQEIRN